MEEMLSQNYRSSLEDTGCLRVQLSELGDAQANKIKTSFWAGCLDVFVVWAIGGTDSMLPITKPKCASGTDVVLEKVWSQKASG